MGEHRVSGQADQSQIARQLDAQIPSHLILATDASSEVKDGELVGVPDPAFDVTAKRDMVAPKGMGNQRGLRFV